MRKPLIGFSLIILIAFAQLIATAPLPRKSSLRTQLNPDYLRAVAAYKRLEPKLSREELRAITTIGILNGAKQAEEKMEEHLIEIVKDLVENTDISDQKSLAPKISKIETQIARDQQALDILNKAMDLAMGKMTPREFRKEMHQTLREIHKKTNESGDIKDFEESLGDAEFGEGIADKIASLRENILKQMEIMKQMVDEKIENTLEHIIEQADDNGIIAQASEKVLHKRAVAEQDFDSGAEAEHPAEVRMINSILSEADFRNNLIEDVLEKRKDNAESLDDEFEFDDVSKRVNDNRSNRQGAKNAKATTRNNASNKNKNNNSNNNKNANITANNNNNNIRDVINAIVANVTSSRNTSLGRPAKQQELPALPELPELPEFPPGPVGQAELPDLPFDGPEGGGGGGLVGLITSLSGGEGGSDIGALLGALTGVIGTLFGPGGLDIESLISTGTALISGLLSGDKNFGTVLGIYVGTAFDGLSGGGGAINNGQFIGNFLGTVVASLSADPEEEDGPLQPLLFAENLLNSFLEAKNRKESDEESEPSNGHAKKHPPKKDTGGSDSGAFVKGLVSHLVSTAINVILNASVGAIGGASQASHSLFASSAHKSH